MVKCENPECYNEVKHTFNITRLYKRKYCSEQCKRRHYYINNRMIEIMDATRWNVNNSFRKNENNANYRTRQKKEMMI